MSKLIKKRYAWILFAVAVIAQFVFPIRLILQTRNILANGMEFRVHARDIHRASLSHDHYVRITLEVNIAEGVRHETRAQGLHYIRLQPNAQGFAEVVEISRQPLTGDGVIRIQNLRWGWQQQNTPIILPIDRYYFQGNFTPAIRFGTMENVSATIRVLNGRAVISQLYVGSMRIEDSR